MKIKTKAKTKVFSEGTHYDKKASEMLAKSGLFDAETSDKIIDGLYKQDIPAFHGSGHNWLSKYLKGIVRMLIDEADGDPAKAQDFLERCPNVFHAYFTWVKDNRDKLGTAIDDEFIDRMSYQDVVDKVNEIKAEMNKKSQEELKNMEFTTSNYSLVPINSFQEFNSKYGGEKTGDGTDTNGTYAGHGGTAWCHANDESTYDRWTREGQHFFVLQSNNWEDIPFDAESNAEDYKDAYGNSLIAILTDAWGQLENATLRCNHVWTDHPQGVPSADNQYKSFAELSKVAGFNVEEKVKEFIGDIDENEFFIIQGTILKKLRKEYRDTRCPKHLVVPEGITTIAEGAFEDSTFKTIKLPNSLFRIEHFAFYGNTQLEKIDIPESVVEVGISAFERCISLEDVILPPMNRIEETTFNWCGSLKSVYIPEGVTEIGDHAFQHCEDLTYVSLPKSISKIEVGAFWGCGLKFFSVDKSMPLENIEKATFRECHNLESVDLPDAVKKIYPYAFQGCDEIKELDLRNTSLIGIGSNAFMDCINLEEIKLPKTVQFVSPDAFNGCFKLMHIVTPKLDNVEEWDVNSDCVIDFVGNTNESLRKEAKKMKEEKDKKDVMYDSDEEPEDGHFADDKTDLDFEDDVDEDDILVEDATNPTAEELADAVVDLLNSDTMDWDTGVYVSTEDALDNLASSKALAKLPEEEWDAIWTDSAYDILHKFIVDNPSDANEIFNAVAKAFGYSNYKDYQSYLDWVRYEEEPDEQYPQYGYDAMYGNEEAYSGFDGLDDFDFDKDNGYLDDSESYDWDKEEYKDSFEEATNPSAVANVPAKHKKLDLFNEEDIPEDDVLDEM